MVKLFLSLRYLRSHKIIYFSIAGIAIGITVLIIVTGVLSGFVRELRSRIKGMQSHLMVTRSGDPLIRNHPQLIEEVRHVEGVTHAAPRILWPVMIGKGVVLSNQMFVMLGIDLEAERRHGELPRFFAEGGKKQFNFDHDDQVRRTSHPPLMVGADMPFKVGDVLVLMAFRDTDEGRGYFEQPFEIVGRFKTRMSEYDGAMVLTSLPHARDFLEFSRSDRDREAINMVAVTINERRNAVQIKGDIFKRLPFYRVRTWEEEKPNYLAAVRISQNIQLVILFFIVLVAGFNIVAVFTLKVKAKVKDIGILRSMGITGGGIVSIFLISGFLCGTIGSILGVCMGLSIGFNLGWITDGLEAITGVDLFSKSTYMLESVPFAFDPWAVAMIVGGTMAVSLLSSIYPAIKAANYNPIEAIRYQ